MERESVRQEDITDGVLMCPLPGVCTEAMERGTQRRKEALTKVLIHQEAMNLRLPRDVFGANVGSAIDEFDKSLDRIKTKENRVNSQPNRHALRNLGGK